MQLYDRPSCARGEAENWIKEAQLDLFGTRASCHRFTANQFRLLLATLAYTLMQRLCETALRGTERERASAATIRVRLPKIGAAIVRNTRRVRILLASHHRCDMSAARRPSHGPITLKKCCPRRAIKQGSCVCGIEKSFPTPPIPIAPSLGQPVHPKITAVRLLKKCSG